MKHVFALLLSTLLLTSSAFPLSKTEIADKIIDQSVSSYKRSHGNCPCPFSRAKNGSKCGKRSAWSKPGGQEPICYRKDVKDWM